jgi:hypothetical protein
MSVQNELPGLLKQSIYSLEILLDVVSKEELEQLCGNLLRAYHSKHLLVKQIKNLDKIMLKPVYKQETDSYLTHFKLPVIKVFGRLAQMNTVLKPNELYNSVLNIL